MPRVVLLLTHSYNAFSTTQTERAVALFKQFLDEPLPLLKVCVLCCHACPGVCIYVRVRVRVFLCASRDGVPTHSRSFHTQASVVYVVMLYVCLYVRVCALFLCVCA